MGPPLTAVEAPFMPEIAFESNYTAASLQRHACMHFDDAAGRGRDG